MIFVYTDLIMNMYSLKDMNNMKVVQWQDIKYAYTMRKNI